MAHKKGQGSSRNGRESESKRLGVKLFGGQTAIPGNILVRQRGTRFHAGLGVGMGKDHTLFAKEVGIVTFTTKKGNRRYISVLPVDAEEVIATVAKKKEAKVEVTTEVVAEKKAPAKAKKEAKGDDLKKLNGVGPAFEKRLNALGIFTFADMIALTDEAIAKLEEQDSMTSLEEWHNWIAQAKEFTQA
ncbi:MAG: 50S ribosomal protein L27 [Chitinophagales bacterium]|nr:50S ribosomal protein L27 [Chitinophagales bacterium]